jgi:hypothetical protein
MNQIVLKRTTVKFRRPDPQDLALGELAINTEDGLLFFKNSNNELHIISAADTKNNTTQETIKTCLMAVWLVISCLLLAVLLKSFYNANFY